MSEQDYENTIYRLDERIKHHVEENETMQLVLAQEVEQRMKLEDENHRLKKALKETEVLLQQELDERYGAE